MARRIVPVRGFAVRFEEFSFMFTRLSSLLAAKELPWRQAREDQAPFGAVGGYEAPVRRLFGIMRLRRAGGQRGASGWGRFVILAPGLRGWGSGGFLRLEAR